MAGPETPPTAPPPPAPAAPAAPTTLPPTPAPAPAAPAPPVVPAPAAPPAQADPWTARLLADMGKVLKDGQIQNATVSPPAAPEPAPAPASTTPAPAAAPAEPAPPELPAAPADPPAPTKKKVQVAQEQPIESVIEGVVRRIAQESPTPVVAPASPEPPPAKDPDADYVAGLTDLQKEDLALAQFAAANMPDKYAQQPKKLIAFYKKVDEYVAAKQKEDPSWSHEKDDEYQSFMADNRPEYSGADQRRLERQQITEEVTAKTEAKIKPKLEEAEFRTRANELKPQIEGETAEYQKALLQRMSADATSPLAPALAKLKEKGFSEEGWTEAAAADPLAAQVAKQYAQQATSLAREYIELASGVKKNSEYNPKLAPDSEQNRTAVKQSRLFAFIDQQESEFMQHGGKALTKDGKVFVSRAQYQQLPAAQRARHWTLGHEDVLDTLAIAAEMEAKKALSAEMARLEKAGYVRPPKLAAPKPEEKPAAPAAKPEASPIAKVAQAPGAGVPNQTNGDGALFTEAELRRNWTSGAKSWV